MVKHISGYDISCQIENCKAYVKGFSSAKTECMKDYTQSTTREKLDHVSFTLVLMIFQPGGNQMS